jgi:hypothetical protein
MKNVKISLLGILLTGMSVFHHSCSDEIDPIADITPAQVENQIQSNSWKIALFIDSDKDETHHFEGYGFTFEADGRMIAENSANQFVGSWYISEDKSSDDSRDELELVINFSISNEFEELNEDWNLVLSSDSKIEFIHISGGNGGTDYLTFAAL